MFSKRFLIGLTSLGIMAVPVLASADTTNSTVQVTVSGVISAFTTSGTVTLGGLTPDATGTQSANKDVVTVNTNSTNGYTLTLKDADTNYNLVSGSNNFTPTSGTPAAPATLSNGNWGWRVDSLAGFGAGPTGVLNNGSPSSLTYAAIPTTASPYTIKTTSAIGSSSVDVWYSARANNTQPTGTYTNIVTYTATAN